MGPNQRRRAFRSVICVCTAGSFEYVGAYAFFGGEAGVAVGCFLVAGFLLGAAVAWVVDDRRADQAYWEELRRSARELSLQEALDKNSFAGWRRHGKS
jgi:hypothetical protein